MTLSYRLFRSECNCKRHTCKTASHGHINSICILIANYRKPGDDHKMLMCDTCDKGYHIFCLKPAMSSVPKHGWKCKVSRGDHPLILFENLNSVECVVNSSLQNCRICMDCGARTPGAGPSSRWHKNYLVCDGCYQQRNKGLACPICHRAYRCFSCKEMLQCSQCKKLVSSPGHHCFFILRLFFFYPLVKLRSRSVRCIHLECAPTSRSLDKSEYLCPLCLGSSQVSCSAASSNLVIYAPSSGFRANYHTYVSYAGI